MVGGFGGVGGRAGKVNCLSLRPKLVVSSRHSEYASGCLGHSGFFFWILV